MDYKKLNCEFIKGIKSSQKKIVLLHGWGHSIENMRHIANNLSDYDCYLIDLPGFGKSTPQEDVVNVSDYTALIADFIKHTFSSSDKVYVVGHSFGGRIAICLGAKYSSLVSGIFVVAGAGLRKKRGLKKSLIINSVKLLKFIYQFMGGDVNKSPLFKKIYSRIASTDYKNASPFMRQVLKNTVNENLSSIAKQITIPTILVYGKYDTVTPPYFGVRYHKLIKNSELFILPNLNHTSILDVGRYQVSAIISNYIENTK